MFCRLLAFGSLLVFACSEQRDLTAGTPDELVQALSRAVPGDRIVLTARDYSGAFEVPAGVTLDGNGARLSGTGPPVLRVAGGESSPTLILNLEIANSGIGLLGGQGGTLSLSDVRIDVATGAGLIAGDIERLILTRVTVAGSVTEDDLSELGAEVDPLRFAALGIAARDLELDWTLVDVSGFAGFGVLLSGASGPWNGGTLSGNTGPALLAEASQLSLDGVNVSSGRSGQLFGNSLPVGMVISGGSLLVTQDLSITDIEGPGILQDAASSEHTALSIDGTDYAGIWVQNSTSTPRALSLSGGSLITRVRGSGVHLRAVNGASFDGLTVSDTAKRSSLSADTGDGIQALALTGELVLRETELSDNARSGLLFDGAESAAPPSVRVDGLSITGSGEYGLLIQNSLEDFRADAVVQAELDQRDRAAMASGLLLEAQSESFSALAPLGDRVTESGIIGEDGQLRPWTPEGGP